MFIQKTKKIVAGEEVDVAPEAATLLFEANDVAELLAEVTDEVVEASVDDETGDVIFEVGEEEFTVSPEGSEEILESRKISGGKRPVRASAKRKARKPVTASTKGSRHVITRKVPTNK